MRAVFGLVLLVGMGLAGFAVYMVNQYMATQTAQFDRARQIAAQALATVDVYVTTRSVTYGEQLTADDVRLVPYQAPLQMKSTGGIFIVDDLGRQTEPPQMLVNRWIVPLEENRDILALQSGEKFEVPFDTLVVFSTNFHPNAIFDKAALRRIFYKIKIDGPNQEDYLKIFAMVARKRQMPLDEDTLVHLLNVRYPEINNIYANFHPTFLIDHMISICDFEGIPYHMSPDLLDRAWANMFVTDEDIVR